MIAFSPLPWRRAWQPTPVFLLGESHGQRSWAGYTGHQVAKSDTILGLFFAESGLKTPGKWGAQVLNPPLLQLLLASTGSGQGDALQFMNPSSPPLCSPILQMPRLGSLSLLFPPQSFPDPGSCPRLTARVHLSLQGRARAPTPTSTGDGHHCPPPLG